MSEFAGALFGRAQEPADEVVMPRAVVESQGLQPEDLGALMFLLLRDPGETATGKAVSADMRALGWKMSVDRFEVVSKRLMAAGHLRRESVYDPKTRRPQWHYWAYRNPANNPEYVNKGTSAFPQVRAEIGENPVPAGEAAREIGENPVSPGQSRNRVFPGSGAESGKTRFPSDDVSAGQSRNREKPDFPSPPPTPPREEETSSPLPPTDPSGASASPRGEEEAAVPRFPEERLAQARVWLGRLPYPWTVGRQAAYRLAPLLLEAADDQGWALDGDLAAELTKNPDGVHNHVRTLEKVRIPNLIRREMARRCGEDRKPSRAEIDAAIRERLRRATGL
ncbi:MULTISPECIES: hypothetical protein [Streptomyces]|uniref:hypothetical protein n=1 Tax=Streptomyces TaxID=1883 RepID=UPI00163CC507|nr:MULTISPECIES: hypothetical protein [Streptomyces]MBC2879795.1 hypothetical protein [Streptomyces sp. TYQ1024]UBI41401.1 hypothetical protein K7I03_33595 [Streptomyces mobaraensis]